MKNLLVIGFIALAVGLVGCNKDKKSGNSAVAVTPANNTCSQYTYRNGFYYDAQGRVVTCHTTNNNCSQYRWDPNQGFYVDVNGARVDCQNNVFNNSNVYPYYTVNGNGCSVYTHGVFYPVLMGSTLVCMGYSTLSANFTTQYLNSIYMGGMWNPGNPILASCYAGSPNCRCGDWLGGTLQWCWSTF
ncbi:MAG: hypothetical protein KDD43_05760 [Bdellovibrionales bacterium]|nr:hypothetical protein [Bdellovibrionales bacterium]